MSIVCETFLIQLKYGGVKMGFARIHNYKRACGYISWFRSVHTTKMKSKGLPVTTLPLVLFADDTSGNVSKKWNKFIEWNMIVAGIVLG